jgi:hypothetical protein
MKVNENLMYQNTDATKVTAAEREKKKTHEAPLTVTIKRKTTSKRKNPSTSEKDKGVVIEEQQPEAMKPQGKKSGTDSTAEADGNVDVLATPQIQPSTFYPPQAKEVKEPKCQPVIAPVDPTEAAEIEARSERARIYFLSTCPPGGRMKQTLEKEVASKRYWDHYE